MRPYPSDPLQPPPTPDPNRHHPQASNPNSFPIAPPQLCNWLTTPSPVTGQPLQLAFLPPSVNVPPWPMSAPNPSQQATATDPEHFIPNPTTLIPPKKKRRQSKKQNLPTPEGSESRMSWRNDFNFENKCAIVLIIEWLGCATSTGTRYDWWKGEKDSVEDRMYSKRELGERIAAHLAENGLPGRDGKGIETQIRGLEASFTKAHDFRSQTGQGILDDDMEKARDLKDFNGYSSDSSEWKALQNSVKSKFDKLLLQRCPYYYDLVEFMSRRSNVVPEDVREAGADLDEEMILPSSKGGRESSPDANRSRSNDDDIDFPDSQPLFRDRLPSVLAQEVDTTPWESPVSLPSEIAGPSDYGNFPPSDSIDPPPTPLETGAKLTSRRPVGRPPKRSRQFLNEEERRTGSTSTSASDVHDFLSAQLPTREEKSAKSSLDRERWAVKAHHLEAEREARKLEVDTQSRLADAVARHLSGGNFGENPAEQAE